MVSLPSERFTRFGNPAWPGGRTANFAAFGAWPWVLPKNVESLRDSDALMRVAVPRRRGPAGLRDLFRFCRNCGLYALFQILLSVLQTLQLVLFLCKLRLGPVPCRLGAVQGFSVLSLGLTSFFDFGDKKRPSTFRTLRPADGQFFSIRFSCSVRQTGIVYCFFFTTKPITNKIIAGITKNKAFTNTHK